MYIEGLRLRKIIQKMRATSLQDFPCPPGPSKKKILIDIYMSNSYSYTLKMSNSIHNEVANLSYEARIAYKRKHPKLWRPPRQYLQRERSENNKQQNLSRMFDDDVSQESDDAACGLFPACLIPSINFRIIIKHLLI